MKTLLLAIGIVLAFGAMFLLDRWNTGNKDEPETDSEDIENP